MTAVQPATPVTTTTTTKTAPNPLLPRIITELTAILAGLGTLATAAYTNLQLHSSRANSFGIGGAVLLVGGLISRFGHDATVLKAKVAKYGPEAEDVIRVVGSDFPKLSARTEQIAIHAENRLHALEVKAEAQPAVADVEAVARRTVELLTGKPAATAPASATTTIQAQPPADGPGMVPAAG